MKVIRRNGVWTVYRNGKPFISFQRLWDAFECVAGAWKTKPEKSE